MNTLNSKLKVAVLMGGIGSERQISIQSGTCVAQALRQAGFEVIEADIGPDNLTILDDKTIDIFFPALHGEFGEDGRLQQILEDKSLLYVGSGPTASEAAFNKITSKKLFTEAGAAIPDAIEYNIQIEKHELEEQLRYLADKYVVKPIKQGSSVGVSITSTKRETSDLQIHRRYLLRLRRVTWARPLNYPLFTLSSEYRVARTNLFVRVVTPYHVSRRYYLQLQRVTWAKPLNYPFLML